MISYLLSRIIVLVLGNLYPAYSSYKAVRTKNVKEYVKWMMYWIVFAIFTLVETFADILVSFWFPFYYEIKIIFLLWLLCPATKGSSIIYRRFLHPTLTEREAEIDEAIAKVTEQGYTAVLQLGSKGVNYATTVLMQTAIKNLSNKAINQASQGTSTTDSVSAISSSASSSKTSSMDTRTDHLDGVVPQKTRTAGLRKHQLREVESSDDDDDDYQESMDIGDKTAKKIAEALENDDDYISDDSVEFLDDSERTENEFVPKVKIEPQVGMNLRSRKKKVYSLHYESDDSLDY